MIFRGDSCTLLSENLNQIDVDNRMVLSVDFLKYEQFQRGCSNWCLGGGFKYFFNFHPYLGKIPIWTDIFQWG